jgi:nucleoside-diphosphate-sugar epimerase
MRILITGASGFIGGSLAGRLREHPVPDLEVATPRRSDLPLEDGAAVARLLARFAPQVIVHLAACTARGEDEASRARQWRDTFLAGRVVLERAIEAGVPHLVMVGSVEELGDASGVLSPDLPPRPRSTYGLCKSLLLQVAEFTARRHRVRIDWARLFTVYGPGQTGDMLVPYAFRAARERRPADFTDGRQRRDFLYIDDLTDWLVRALRVDAGAIGVHRHHVGTGTGTTVREVLDAIAAEFPGSLFNVGARARRPGEADEQVAPRCRAADAPPLDGWSPAMDWRTGIARTAAFWRQAR